MAASQSTASAARQRESTFGVQSLADTLEAAFGPESTAAAPQSEDARLTQDHEKPNSRSGSVSSSAGPAKAPGGTKSSPLHKLKRKLSNHGSPVVCAPSTVEAPSPLPTSVMSSTPRSASMQSLKLSDEDSAIDDAASQAIASSGDEEDVEAQQDVSTSFPQLVMPSIQMPTRRPFTTRGKAMGKLKVMVAGEQGKLLPRIQCALGHRALWSSC